MITLIQISRNNEPEKPSTFSSDTQTKTLIQDKIFIGLTVSVF